MTVKPFSAQNWFAWRPVRIAKSGRLAWLRMVSKWTATDGSVAYLEKVPPRTFVGNGLTILGGHWPPKQAD
jgi:hypothetical protein